MNIVTTDYECIFCSQKIATGEPIYQMMDGKFQETMRSQEGALEIEFYHDGEEQIEIHVNCWNGLVQGHAPPNEQECVAELKKSLGAMDGDLSLYSVNDANVWCKTHDQLYSKCDKNDESKTE